MKWGHIAIVSMALALAGCATAPVQLATLPGEIRYTPEDAVPVRLDENAARREEHIWSALGEEKHTHVITGGIWSRVFVSYKPDQPSLTISSSKLEEHVAGAGFTIRYTYTVQAVLHINGHDVPITASGTRASGMAIGSAMRQAVELAVVDAAHQARTIIAANASADISEPGAR